MEYYNIIYYDKPAHFTKQHYFLMVNDLFRRNKNFVFTLIKRTFLRNKKLYIHKINQTKAKTQ